MRLRRGNPADFIGQAESIIAEMILTQAETDLREARRAQKQNRPEGYVQEAKILFALGRPQEALEALQRGTRRMPHIWMLWCELGDLLDEMGRVDEAVNAYNRAMHCPDAPVEEILYAKLTTLIHHRRLDEAMLIFPLAEAHLEMLVAPARRNEWFDLAKAHIFILKGDYDSARVLLDALETAVEQYPAEDKDSLHSAVLTERARLLWLEKGDRAAAEQYAYRAYYLERLAPHALQLLYDMRRDDPCTPKNIYEVQVSSVIVRDGVRDFRLTDYLVVAENGKQAKEMVRPFEADAETVHIFQPRIRWTIKEFRETVRDVPLHCGVIAAREGDGLMRLLSHAPNLPPLF
ncbi:MAG: tetratricopeptide repeat protein [Fimbriimonadales bacterium]|nr:tetratricopeptide repeat protein [Fimbriimonadales bacterium]